MDSPGPKIKVRKFDPSKMRSDAFCIMLGKRGTGKSSLLMDILYHHKDLPAGCVISGSEEANGFYSNTVPSILIKNEFKTDHVKNLVTRQRQLINNSKKNGATVDPRAFLILDDCLFDNTWSKDREIRRVVLNGRHYRISFMITMQYPLGLPPMLRGNVDYVFILRENVRSNRERIYSSYAGVFPTFDIFEQVMNKLTTDYGCLVIDNTIASNNLFDCIYWYKAEMRAPFKMCHESLWRLDETYRQQLEKEQKHIVDNDDPDGHPQNELMAMRKAPRVFVQKLMETSHK
jgi:hypothetical protein